MQQQPDKQQQQQQGELLAPQPGKWQEQPGS